jgi:cyclophilin family peptidyl-prolyl cis-trans isomerase
MRAALAAALLSLLAPAAGANPVVRFTTVLGSFDVELCAGLSPACPGVAPNTVANFLRYVDEDRYPPTGFVHRRGVGWSPPVIQGGGYWVDGEPGDPLFTIRSVTAFDPIALELGSGLSNVRGTIAMARSQALHSATSQWFVNLVDNVGLDSAGGGYAVFGRVTTGLDVVDAIGAVPVYSFQAPFGELPLVGWTGEQASAKDHFVYVTAVERVPEPAAGHPAAGALALLAGRRARACRRRSPRRIAVGAERDYAPAP